MNCLRHDNQEHSHREARLSGRMPQIAPLRFAVRQTQCIAPRAHSALAQKRSNCADAHWSCNSSNGVRSTRIHGVGNVPTRIHDGSAVNSWSNVCAAIQREFMKPWASIHDGSAVNSWCFSTNSLILYNYTHRKGRDTKFSISTLFCLRL